MKIVGFILCISLGTVVMQAQEYINGADFSYVNEMEDCGATYKENDTVKDIYDMFTAHGADLFRYRLWHTPDWTDYSTYADVHKAIGRAKAVNAKVLLDFHYSDTWADPGTQIRPAAWSGITDLEVLKDSMYNYTFQVLNQLRQDELLPDYVQVGNEINGNILLEEGEPMGSINWSRKVELLQAGIDAVRDVQALADTTIGVVIHFAEPLNGDYFFTSATNNGLSDFDIMGLSYYPNWHEGNVQDVGNEVSALIEKFNKELMIVEVGNPWTLQGDDGANNILTADAILPGYPDPPTPEGQKNFMIDLTYAVISNGGMGVIYWEPAWVSTGCETQWGTGSHYENATFFDFDYNLLPAIDYYSYDYSVAPPKPEAQVLFKVDMTGVDTTNGVFVTGDFTGEEWQFMRMNHTGDMIFEYQASIPLSSSGAFIFTKNDDWDTDLYHEQVPAACAEMWDTHRQYVIDELEKEYAFTWNTCDPPSNTVTSIHKIPAHSYRIYPNPAKEYVTVKSEQTINELRVMDVQGVHHKVISNINQLSQQIDVSDLSNGYYLLMLLAENGTITKSFIVNNNKL